MRILKKGHRPPNIIVGDVPL